MLLRSLCFSLLFFTGTLASAQTSDSLAQDSIALDTFQDKQVTKVKKSSIFSGKPGKSLLFSLVLPGSGQVYNKSYLRVPFVYAAIGAAGYNLHRTSRQYKCLSDAYVSAIDGDPIVYPEKCMFKNGALKELHLITDAPTLRIYRDQINKRRQLAIVLFALAWLANGIDAYVDSHLKSFDMDESLSIDFGPIMDDDPNAQMRMGLVVKF